jgi:hypothetical protein
MSRIRAGQIAEADLSSGAWAFVDPGFSRNAKSCGLVDADGEPSRLTFAQLEAELVALVRRAGGPLNLVIEAPLSVAFGPKGNPVGRSVELRGRQSRYWYVGLGCSVLVAATYLLRALTDACPEREVRLFEGLVSFKPRGTRSSHCDDVLQLRQVILGDRAVGRVVPPEELAGSPEHSLKSAFAVSGMDYGIPPVLVVGG